MNAFRLTCFLILLLHVGAANAFNIVIDYTYDTMSFFSTQVRKDALQAAADRYSTLIDSSLGAVSTSDNGGDWRIGFTHPGDGSSYQLSVASGTGDDTIDDVAAPADEYGFAGLVADTWILYAGGRSLSVAGQGGTGTGTNYTTTFEDPDGPHRRGLIPPTIGDAVEDLPVWGGAIAFDNDGSTTWHFDHTTASGTGETDFYTIALHEVGHALGLSTSWNQWEDDGSGNYTGAEALAAYNADNGTSLTSLNQVSSSNTHWEDGTYQSEIFPSGDPNLVGTVGTGSLQDLLMEPTANFTGSTRRFELTNTDVGALEDLGYSVIPEPSTLLLLALGGVLYVVRRRRSF